MPSHHRVNTPICYSLLSRLNRINQSSQVEKNEDYGIHLVREWEFLKKFLKETIKSGEKKKMKKKRNLKQMLSESPPARALMWRHQFLALSTESFNYMQFALGWAISIFYVDTLPLQHAFIHFHSGDRALSKNRLFIRPCWVLYYCVSLDRE